jgi:licheninase
MSRRRWTVVLLVLAVGLGLGCDAGQQSETGAVGTSPADDWPNDPQWTQVWGDEFDGNGRPDTTKWHYEVGGHGWGNRERQYYTEARPENARIEDGHLIIEARREAYEGSDYTSARLNSARSWTYGRFEIRAQVPRGRGTWPALWLLASQDTYGDAFWPDNGEIDIMEHVGFDPNVIHSTVHTEAFNHTIGTQRGDTVHVPTATAAYHVYALEWTPTAIRAFVDGEQYFTFRKEGGADYTRWPFNHDFHLIMNVAVGGEWGGAEGVATDVWPAAMRVDYVRVYKPESRVD